MTQLYVKFEIVDSQVPKLLRALLLDSLNPMHIIKIAETELSFIRTDAELLLSHFDIKSVQLVDDELNSVDTDCLSTAEVVECMYS